MLLNSIGTIRSINGYTFEFLFATTGQNQVALMGDEIDVSNPKYLTALLEAKRLATTYRDAVLFLHLSRHNAKTFKYTHATLEELADRKQIIESAIVQTDWDIDIEFAKNFLIPIDLELTRRKTIQHLQVKANPGYVYLIRSSSGTYKIGKTKNPDDRMRTFSVKLPFEIEYEHLIPTDNMNKLEKDLHERFADQRVNGEWFNLSPSDVDYIKGLTQ